MVVFTTLAEKKYFLGVSALINSIIENGTYATKIVIGYRGELPNWLPELENSKNGKSFFIDNLEVEFVEVKGALHMVHEKPTWFKYLTFELEPDAEEYFFFDSDITVINRMDFFGEWVKQGVAICEDINYDMSSTHPVRKQWAKIVESKGRIVTNPNLSRYYNSGFLGWTRDHKDFILDWYDAFIWLKELSGDLTRFRTKDRTNVVLSANQDSLNLAVMMTNCDISVIGPEAMGFHYGLSLMQHPLGAKPWNLSFVKNAFRGIPPRYSDLLFWKNVNGIISPYPVGYVKRKNRAIKLAKFISRFYKKLD